MNGVENNCNGECHEIYPTEDGHIKQRVGDERILESNGQFCGAFYHVHEWGTREHYCLDETNCIIGQRATNENNWRVQAKTVVAVVKFEDENEEILYEARYTNCGEEQKHAEEFFKEDIENENGVLAQIVEDNPNGIITLYLTLQPCNQSTSILGTANTPACCETLTTIVNDILPPEITLCVKAANTCRLSLIPENDPDDETLRQNAVAGIKMLMEIEHVAVIWMEKDDWHYLFSLTNELENREDLEVHEGRLDLDKCVQDILAQIQDEINQDETGQNENDQDGIDQNGMDQNGMDQDEMDQDEIYQA
ncbi:predicted protein [Paramuricea clavata]|uniref:Uncharacterized protein n=1 Tax=Paramuricea clavata TaxID=317549 RepID=A0A7D9M6U7_PARCT|nr:predicted protein [Paramuricea clavata]